VRIAALRGLQVPRKHCPPVHVNIGIHGGELTEALLVNVLRRALDDESLHRAWSEAQGVEHLTGDFGVAAAVADAGLERLRAALAERPVLAALLGRILVWYDYSCLPQPPCSEADHALFLAGLENLVVFQRVACTVILLDDLEDYLSRGWCTLEALVADEAHAGSQLLVGAVRRTNRDGTVEHEFEMLLQDRPHLVWRAVLDTEVFAIQDMRCCLRRLGLAVTEARDLPIVYGKLLELGAPRKVHIDDGELVTGVYPVVRLDDGRARVPDGHRTRTKPAAPSGTLDWSDALIARPIALPAMPSLVRFERSGTGRPACHVAVVAACEGEAALFAQRVVDRRAELEDRLDVEVVSLSWLASDIAPVGHLVDGRLRGVPVAAEAWVVVGTEARIDSALAGGMIDALAGSGAPCWVLAIDRSTDNLGLAEADDGTRDVDVPDDGFPVANGGAFRGDLLALLFGPGDADADPGTDRRAAPQRRSDAMSDPTTTTELRDQLFAAIDTGDSERLLQLVNGYSKYVIESFDDWRKPPEPFRHGAAEQQRWMHFLVTLAQLFEDNGVPELMQCLTGGADNAMTRWNDGFSKADRLQEAGRYQESNDLLLPILRELGTMSGPGVDRIHGAVLGMIGTNYFRLGQRAEARHYTELALAECRRVGDEAGVRSYTENLDIIG
jgi:xanthosine utilization system XapX-like protein